MKFNTKFYDKSYILDEIPSNSYEYNINKKIAIHIHIFYIDMLDMFIDYLKNSPYKFDLLISVNSEENKNICIKKINNNSLKKLNKLLIKVVPNIGRDIAPLLIDFKEEQKEYDFICHIHTKKSLHNPAQKNWNNYLLNNLISQSAIENIIYNFIENNNIGIIFPPIFPETFHYILELNELDKLNMRKLLDRMNINFIPDSSNFIFPTGTMFWYRKNVLKNLFDLNLLLDDLPKEPIPVTGTILHAIERLFGIVCEYNGYKIKCYIDRKELVNALFYTYDLIEIRFENERIRFENERIRFENERIRLNCNWFNLFGISNNSEYLRLTLFGIKFTFRVNEDIINNLAWWIPIRKLRDNFRNKFK